MPNIKVLNVIFLVFSFVSVCGQNPELLSAEGWEFKKEKYDIKIYSKNLENYKVKAFKVIGLVEEDMATVYNALMDIGSYSKWYPDCEFGEVLKEDGQVQVRQIVFDLPWPFDSRRAINKIISRKEGPNIWLEIVSAADYLPAQKKIVTIPRAEGYWLIEPVEKGTMLTYCAVGEAPGVPTWIVNLFIFDSPVEAINNLRKVVLDEKYQSAPDWLK